MNKKILAMLLALLMVFSCAAVSASAEDVDLTQPGISGDIDEPSGNDEPEEPAYVQWKVGDIIPVGGLICSENDAASLRVVYTATVPEGENFTINSALSTQFRDDISALQDEPYNGGYAVKKIGDLAGQYYDETTGTWESTAPGAVVNKDDTWVDEALRMPLPKEIIIDFEVDDGRMLDYMKLVGWEVLEITDDFSGVTVTLNASWEMREPNWFESILESIYANIVRLINEVSDYFNVAIPKFILKWAQLLGYGQ